MGHREDFWETIRSTLYPILHVVLELFDIGARGTTPEAEYVGTIPVGAEDFEVTLHEAGLVRNALAKYKSTEDGRNSIGSWRATHNTHPDLVDDGMQLHITLFSPRLPSDGWPREGVDVYAHYERDYGHDASGHLAGKDYSAKKGVVRARELLKDHTITRRPT